MPNGLFQGIISGLTGSVGQGILDNAQRQHDENIADKRARLSILQHAFDSGKLDEEGENSALNQLMDLTGPAGSTGKNKVAEEGKKVLHATLLPLRLLRKMGSKSDDSPSGTTPSADPTDGSLPPAPTRTPVPQPQASVLPPAPQRTAPPMHVLTAEEKRLRENQATQDKVDITTKAQLDLAEQERLQKTKEAQVALESDFQQAEKYLGKTRDKFSPDQTERILEKNGILSPAKTPRAPYQLGNVKGSDLDPDTVKQFGLDPNRLYKHTQDVDTGADHFYPINEKLSPTEERMKNDMDQIRATVPALANASDEIARKAVLVNRAQKARLQIANLQETITGKKLSDQMKNDIISGKVTPVTARAVLNYSLSQARALNNDPGSEDFLKGIDAIQNSILSEAGYDPTEIMKAAGGKTTPAAAPATAPDPNNPLGLNLKKKK